MHPVAVRVGAVQSVRSRTIPYGVSDTSAGTLWDPVPPMWPPVTYQPVTPRAPRDRLGQDCSVWLEVGLPWPGGALKPLCSTLRHPRSHVEGCVLLSGGRALRFCCSRSYACFARRPPGLRSCSFGFGPGGCSPILIRRAVLLAVLAVKPFPNRGLQGASCRSRMSAAPLAKRAPSALWECCTSSHELAVPCAANRRRLILGLVGILARRALRASSGLGAQAVFCC